jgi:Fibronectin type III-like domain
VGAEVAQIYLGLPASTVEPPKRLVGWAKVELEPGETEEIIVTLDPHATLHPLSYLLPPILTCSTYGRQFLQRPNRVKECPSMTKSAWFPMATN